MSMYDSLSGPTRSMYVWVVDIAAEHAECSCHAGSKPRGVDVGGGVGRNSGSGEERLKMVVEVCPKGKVCA